MAKSSRRRSSEYTKTAVALSELATKRVGSACVALKCTQSELIEELINTHLSAYDIQAPRKEDRIKVTKRVRPAKPKESSRNAPSETNGGAPKPVAEPAAELPSNL